MGEGWWIKIFESKIKSLSGLFRYFSSNDLINISIYFSYLSALGITEHAKKRTQYLSGATKRKVIVFYKCMLD